MHITMPENTWKEMVKKAQITSQKQNTDFEVEANMSFVYEGKEENYIVDFKLGGKSSTEFSKPGYNIKIKSGDNKSLHGTKHFRLRSDQRDASMMRSKITTDILQKSGLIAVEVGYTELYINNKYMGFWVVSDSVKSKWIKRKFGNNNNEDIKTLYQCKDDSIRFDDESAKNKCVNAEKSYADYMEPFNNFVDQVNAAKTRADLEKIMDVDNFIKYMAWEWLMGSWDHFLGIYGHNLYWYQQPNGKWVYIPYDHDIELGQDLWTKFYPNKPFNHMEDIDFTNVSFKDFELNHPIIKILIHDDDTIFRELLGDIISRVFNPDTLLIHIDEIKKLISPYVKKDRNNNSSKINKRGKDLGFTYEHFLLNSEYTYINNYIKGFKGYGLKDWIRRRYQFAANYYGIYTDTDSSISSNQKHKLIEPRPEPVILSYKSKINKKISGITSLNILYQTIDPPLPDYIPDKTYANHQIPILGVNQYNLNRKSTKSISSTILYTNTTTKIIPTTTTKVKTITNTITSITTITKTKTKTSIIEPTVESENNPCPGIKLGYSCCEKCNSLITNKDGSWSLENFKICSIKYSCF
ncbi:hypothetical protein BCR32DRAFT_220708 [Anaeromyces robustus]|uniref:CBM10 domain-containing protein n=1 Tax=Anaeromyces robustus TaxID=1754192 RepID=A0A1Y1X4W6_9FUNG|nr:hypothetical protein BCR32DRAFT_220708 [Anaeromyces robustus]|eukprot:ORX80823.1 hypothetical protein BCR32DRAFT_220708 [Anaeromyces robustus]